MFQVLRIPGNESFGSRSKLKRRYNFNHAFCKISKRLLRWVARDGTILSVLILLIIAIQLGERVELIVSYLKMEPSKAGDIRGQHIQNIAVQQATGPPSYLPLAQHLRNINSTKNSPSLQDMAYGVQKKTQPDLRPTNNNDLDNCGRCRRNCKRLLKSTFASSKNLKLAQIITKVITFYDVSSMLVIPCEKEVRWLLPLFKTIRTWNPTFKHFCAVSDDGVAVDIIKKYSASAVNGTVFVRYKSSAPGGLPKVDMMFSWRGLEHSSLDDIHQVFKDVVLSGTKYTLVGSLPSHPNAKMVESSKGVFSIVRPEILALNVRAFPFGFDRAQRVIPLLEMQLLLYNSSQMRDVW